MVVNAAMVGLSVWDLEVHSRTVKQCEYLFIEDDRMWTLELIENILSALGGFPQKATSVARDQECE